MNIHEFDHSERVYYKEIIDFIKWLLFFQTEKKTFKFLQIRKWMNLETEKREIKSSDIVFESHQREFLISNFDKQKKKTIVDR